MLVFSHTHIHCVKKVTKLLPRTIGADFRFEVPGQSSVGLIRGEKGSMVGGHHGECGARAYNEGLGQSPQRGPGVEPLVRGAIPAEAESILVIACLTEPAKFSPFSQI